MGHADNHEELRDAAIAEAARKHAAAIRTNVLTGNQQALHDLANALGDRLSAPGVSDQLIRAALVSGPVTAGKLLADLIQKCIDSDAELVAIQHVEQLEADARAERRERALAGAMAHMMATH